MSSAMKDFRLLPPVRVERPVRGGPHEQYLQDPARPDARRAQFDQWQGSGNKDVAHGPVIAAAARELRLRGRSACRRRRQDLKVPSTSAPTA
jgi:hypothetical protein